jgi:hypothetical protein
MQAMRNTLSENIWVQSVELLNRHVAAVIDLQLWFVEILCRSEMNGAPRSRTSHRNHDDDSAPAGATTRFSDRPGPLSGARVVASELNDRIEIWVNEGGAGGEVNR